MGALAADLGPEPGSSCFLVPRSECPLVGAAGKGAALPARWAPAPSPASQGLVRSSGGRGRRAWQGHSQEPPLSRNPVMRKAFSSWERQSETGPGQAGTRGLQDEEESRGRGIQGKVRVPGSRGGSVQAEGSEPPGRGPAAPPRARLPSPAGPAPAPAWPPPPPAAQSPPRGARGRAAPPSGSLPPSARHISYQPSFRTFRASSFQTPGQGAGRARAPGSRRPRPRPPGEWRPPRRARRPPAARRPLGRVRRGSFLPRSPFPPRTSRPGRRPRCPPFRRWPPSCLPLAG